MSPILLLLWFHSFLLFKIPTCSWQLRFAKTLRGAKWKCSGLIRARLRFYTSCFVLIAFFLLLIPLHGLCLHCLSSSLLHLFSLEFWNAALNPILVQPKHPFLFSCLVAVMGFYWHKDLKELDMQISESYVPRQASCFRECWLANMSYKPRLLLSYHLEKDLSHKQSTSTSELQFDWTNLIGP